MLTDCGMTFKSWQAHLVTCCTEEMEKLIQGSCDQHNYQAITVNLLARRTPVLYETFGHPISLSILKYDAILSETLTAPFNKQQLQSLLNSIFLHDLVPGFLVPRTQLRTGEHITEISHGSHFTAGLRLPDFRK